MTQAPARTVAVLTHGAGSTGEFVRRALPAAALGVDDVVALDDRTGRVDEVMDLIDAAARSALARGDRVVVGGVSLGAHAAARWAVERAPADGVDRLVLALPAWTGPPDHVAAATAAAADEIEAVGSREVLRRLAGDPAHAGDWVVAELARAWPVYGDAVLVRALRNAGSSHGPTVAVLRRITMRATVVALADDPLHPATVAREWSRALVDARLVVRPRGAGLPLVG